MIRYLFLLLIGWLIAGSSYGQQALQNQVILRGKVLDKATREPLHFASIIENENNGTASQEDGAFALRMGLSSVVTVTFVGYKPAKIRLPSGFAGIEYTTEVLLEKDVILLQGVSVRKLTEGEFKEQFMELKVETEDEKNARSNIAKIRAQGILGVIPQMDGFDNYRNFVNGPQGVTLFSFGLGGASKSKGLAPALKKATTNPNRFNGPQRGEMPGTKPARDRYNFAKPVPPPVRPDTTRPARATPADTLRQN
jgi:hypothetical protein